VCGVAGGVNFRADIELLKQDLHHRGPNSSGFFQDGKTWLFHTRLAIQDITGGSQPMKREHFIISFNGEIYNHLTLRERYLREFNFKSNSDTETLLYLYIKYKSKMFEYIDGMFAFAIYDIRAKKLTLAVDRAGKKPLFIYKDNSKILFASELNSIKNQLPLKIDDKSIDSYLRVGLFLKQNTPYLNVERVVAGSYIVIDTDSLKVERGSYFDIKSIYETKERITDEKEALERLDLALDKSVKSRLLSSDLEVGAFLSGGIDSSLIVAKASKYLKNLKTFTVAFSGAYDESNLAKLVAKRYNTEHHTLNISINLKDDIAKILTSYGMPFMDSSAIPSYYVSKEAKKYLTVILNGDGADELFGGYRRYVPLANSWLKLAKILSPLLKISPKPSSKMSYYNYLYRLLNISKKSGVDFYLSATSDIFEDYYRFDENEVVDELDTLIKNCDLEPLSKMLCLDFKVILFGDLLVKMDIATMANSLEARSPFLSRYILELAPLISSKLKIRGTKTKYILRELAKNYLPKELINQPKRGFEVPLREWIDTKLKEPIYDLLSKDSYSEQFIKRDFIDRLLNRDSSIAPEKRAKMLWALYSLEVWRRNL